MTNKEIYEILDKLGMVDEEGVCKLEGSPSSADEFQNITCQDIALAIKFIDDLFLQNDENYIKKFLVCLFFNNRSNI